jgi:hypothetical protein
MSGRGSRFSYLLVAVVSAVALVAGAAPPPQATATGCRGRAASQTNSGAPLDSVSAPGSGGTASDPFDVTWTGLIQWSGSSTDPVQHGTWSVGIEPLSGGLSGRALKLAVSSLAHGDVANDSAKASTSGSTRLSDHLSFRGATGVYRVSWDVHDATTTCTGSAVVNIAGNPLTTPAFLVALLFLVLGGFSLLPLMKMLLGGGGR